MTTIKTTKSGVEKRLVRRLQKVSGMKYTTALRVLESMDPRDREDFVIMAEADYENERLIP